MTVNELVNKTGFEVIGDEESLNKEVKGCFIGDLLSWVLGHGQEAQAWVTVQFHPNVIAVAVLKEFSCLILAQGALPSEEGLQKASEAHLAILKTELSAYEIAKKLVKLGI